MRLTKHKTLELEFTCLLSHTAHSRDTLVRGALRAAKWPQGKPPALYSMADVLGIK